MQESSVEKSLSWVKDGLIVLPAFHLSACFLYLVVYDYSFGEGIGLFSTPTDLFSVSVVAIAPAYFALILGSAIGFFAGQGAAKTAWQPSESGVDSAPVSFGYWALRNYHITFGIFSATLLWAMIGLSALVTYLAFDVISYAQAVYFVLVPVSVLIIYNAWNRRLPRLASYIGLTAFVLLSMIAASALQDAQRHKYYPFTELKTGTPECDGKAILASRGAHFLAVSQDGSRSMIDASCEQVAQLQYPQKDIEPRSMRDAIHKLLLR